MDIEKKKIWYIIDKINWYSHYKNGMNGSEKM